MIGPAAVVSSTGRLPPIVALGLAAREIVEARETGEVAAGDHPAARDVGEIARELRPEGGFERHLLAHRDHPAIGQRRRDFGHAVVDFLQAGAAHRDRQMMLAERRAPGGKVVARHRQLTAQAERLIVRRAHPP